MIFGKKEAGGAFLHRHASWLVPLLSLVVIFQTIALIDQERSEQLVESVTSRLAGTPTLVQPQTVFRFQPAAVSMKPGATAEVDLYLIPKQELVLDGMDVVLSFDPQSLSLSKIATPELFSLTTPIRTREKEGRIYVNFLEDKLAGVRVSQETRVLTLTVKSLRPGESAVQLLSAPQGATTVLTESGSSRRLPFTTEGLKVTIKEDNR